MLILSAKPVKEEIEASVKKRAESFVLKSGRKPKLVVVLVGEDPASMVYTNKKATTAIALGMESQNLRYPADVSPEVIREKVMELNQDPAVDGILIQRPLPKNFNEEELVFWVTPAKDVDAFHPEQVGRLSLGLPCFAPCTPAGVIRLLTFYKINLAGKVACVVGRSSIVGKPMAQLLLQQNATLIQCHSHTKDLGKHTREADVLIVAAGKRRMIGKEHVRPGAVVVDVGMHRLENGKLTGDVDYELVATIASAITPVPGGVGPMTIATLLENTMLSAERRGK